MDMAINNRYKEEETDFHSIQGNRRHKYQNNYVIMITSYKTEITFTNIFNQTRKGWKFELEVRQKISEVIMISTVIPLLVNTKVFYKDIW